MYLGICFFIFMFMASMLYIYHHTPQVIQNQRLFHMSSNLLVCVDVFKVQSYRCCTICVYCTRLQYRYVKSPNLILKSTKISEAILYFWFWSWDLHHFHALVLCIPVTMCVTTVYYYCRVAVLLYTVPLYLWFRVTLVLYILAWLLNWMSSFRFRLYIVHTVCSFPFDVWRLTWFSKSQP